MTKNKKAKKATKKSKAIIARAQAQNTNLASAPQPELTPSTQLVRLDLASGQTPREGFEGVDYRAPNAKHKIDLSRFPWTCDCEDHKGLPIPDNSVDELNCSHYIEHIEAVMVDKTGKVVQPGQEGYADAKDAFFAFFDECYRILKPGAWLHVVCPAVRSERAFWDPTHRRFIAQNTFNYLWAEWRMANNLDHYNVECDFGVNLNFSVETEMQAKHPEATKEAYARHWNVIFDFYASLQAWKPNRVVAHREAEAAKAAQGTTPPPA